MSNISVYLFDEYKDVDINGSYFITGYQGFGLVGYLTSKHIAYELSLKRIGFIKTRYMPETTFYTEQHGLSYPFELYYGLVKDKKIMVLVNHAIPHVRERTSYAEYLSLWLKRNKVSTVFLVGGLDSSLKEDMKEKYRWIPINGCTLELDAPKLCEKYVVGPLALTMMFFNANKIPGITILVYTEPYRPDPRASAVAVNVIAKILGIEINTKKLLEEADMIEAIEEEKRKLMKTIKGEIKPERRGFSMHV